MQAKDFEYKGHRNSYTELNEVYFWTITINKWQHLLKADQHKIIIINSLQWLVQKELVKIYGYVIMPNHIHLMWEQLSMNKGGKTIRPKRIYYKRSKNDQLAWVCADLRGWDEKSHASVVRPLCILWEGTCVLFEGGFHPVGKI